MKNRSTWLLLLAFCLLVTALVVLNIQRHDNGAVADDQGPRQRETAIGNSESTHAPLVTRSSRDRSDAAYIQSLVDLRREFDEILPAQYPDQESSLCDANLKPGDTLILGGFKTADGQHEFSALRVDADADAKEPGSYRIATTTFVLSPEQCAQCGLGELLSSAPMRIQKSIVRSTADMKQVITTPSSVISMPAVTAQTNIKASISMGAGNQVRTFSYVAGPGDDGESIRLRTRIESPANAAP